MTPPPIETAMFDLLYFLMKLLFMGFFIGLVGSLLGELASNLRAQFHTPKRRRYYSNGKLVDHRD